MILLLDLETSGLIKKGLPLDSPEQPWCVSLAAELCDSEGNTLALLSTGIRANGRKIADDARKVHGISSAISGRTGVSELAALGVLCGRESFASQALWCVGHGISFDRDVVISLLARHGRDPASWTRPGLQFCDTMTAAAPFCRIPSEHESGGYKWPSLDECCVRLLGEQPREGTHSAIDDLSRTKRLFFWLRSHNAFEMEAA